MSTWLRISKTPTEFFPTKYITDYPYTLHRGNDDGACCGENRVEWEKIKVLTSSEAYAMWLGGTECSFDAEKEFQNTRLIMENSDD